MDWLLKREFNTKCLVISGLAATAYAVLPPKKVWVGVGLAASTHVAIAWYDKLYNCDEKLRSFGGLLGEVTAPFKPAVVDGQYGGSMRGGGPAC